MTSYWTYILIGNDRTGKTSFQRYLIEYLCGTPYDRLHCNKVNDINRQGGHRDLQSLFTCNRSLQEKMPEYRSISNYFATVFRANDTCILSSHASPPAEDEIRDIIYHLKREFYNVAGVFFGNAVTEQTRSIAANCPWTEILWIPNTPLENEEEIQSQLKRCAEDFGNLILRRSFFQ